MVNFIVKCWAKHLGGNPQHTGTSDGIYIIIMETRITELTGKLLALELTLSKCERDITERNKDALMRHEGSISKKTDAIQLLIDEVVELKLIQSESTEDVQEWARAKEKKITKADNTLVKLRELMAELNLENQMQQRKANEDAQRAAYDVESEKQLALERAKLGIQEKHRDQERKKDLEHQRMLEERRSELQKDVDQDRKPREVSSSKRPKLDVKQFNGNISEWLSFWNTFEAEVDKATDIPTITKFSYLKSWLEPNVRADIDGLPFNTEGYQRAKNILKSEYGNTSEIINTHVNNIMGLPTITGTNPVKVNEFYKTLLYNVQSLETLGKVERVNGMTRSVLDKLKGIKADLVRGEGGWQDWDLPRLIVALKKWRDINPVDEFEAQKRPTPVKRAAESKKSSGFFYTKDGERPKRACVYCEKSDHISKDCPNVITTDERKGFLAKNKLCFNCTRPKHRASDCKSTVNCQKCNRKHHTSICAETTADNSLKTTTESKGPVVYPVVLVEVEGVSCRALLDTGAGSSYASAALLNKLPKRNHREEVRRVDMMLGSVTRRMEVSSINVKAVEGNFNIDVEVTKVEKGDLLLIDNPKYERLIEKFGHLKGISMIDDDRKPKLPVHLILGASDYAKIKTTERPRVGKPGEPVGEKTKFGWTLIANGKHVDYTGLLVNQTSQADFEDLCRLDVLGLRDRPENDQGEVYTEFREQLQRSNEGWYETGLPWKGNHPPLPSNKNGSLRRLNNLQGKLEQKGITKSYGDIIEKQKQEGIVELADQPPQGVEFYIPHKPVVREAAQSTKLRIVYDA